MERIAKGEKRRIKYLISKKYVVCIVLVLIYQVLFGRYIQTVAKVVRVEGKGQEHMPGSV